MRIIVVLTCFCRFWGCFLGRSQEEALMAGLKVHLEGLIGGPAVHEVRDLLWSVDMYRAGLLLSSTVEGRSQ